ncbi:hypothetical protein [Clostridium sp. 'White wine YQ']|uniref:hypothetical protein n=1 Tax=Clostridium sp. 'White wine YQ' TaxID=3027474 RepID=UPI002365DF0C|nr:hypothetical protein [Clostridium sp. 'White wine YQ']MDD7796066.1 hypothetical protein [Clostridium sp. 'White wine YQ']
MEYPIMEYQIGEDERDGKSLHDKCKKYMYYHAILKMKDGKMLDGIIEDMDDDNVIMLIPEDIMEDDDDDDDYDHHRQQYGGYGYGRPRRRHRRFRRRRFPFGTLAALSLFRYPYYYPPYPYYPYYPY